MEAFHLKEDLNVLGFQVKSFPTGIGEAFDELIEMLPGGLDRAYYGISYMTHAGIVYLATALEKYPGEAEKYNCERYTIDKGEYSTVTIRDWGKKTHTIKDVFGELTKNECPDETRPCVEWYKDDDEMVCMVRTRKSGTGRSYKTMKDVLFIHSAGPQGHHEGSDYLVKHLKDQLGTDYRILLPEMPDPENPRYKAWKGMLKQEFDSVEDGVILIGHSLGASVILKYLSEEPLQKSIDGLFLIGTVYWGKEDWTVDEYVLHKEFSSKLPHIPKIFLYHSKDDEVVPVTHLRYYAEELPEATLREFESRGHLFGRGLPELIADIKSLNEK